MSNYTIIRPLEGMEQLAQKQWASALEHLGHHVSLFNLRSAHIDPYKDLSNLVNQVLKTKPEIIFVEGAIGFNLPEFFHHESIQKIPVSAFWFDDPLRAVEWRKNYPGYLGALRLENVYHFVWDGYWRDWLKSEHSVTSHPIHLAADPVDFQPASKLEHVDRTVFIGTFVSPGHIAQKTKELPPLFQKLVPELEKKIGAASYAALPYRLLDEVVYELPAKLRAGFKELAQKSPDAILQLRSIAWMLGKNEVRKRILRQALAVSPLLILTGNLEKTHADEREIRDMLVGKNDRLLIKNTAGMGIEKLAELYACGKLHIQATDPQSVNGGIPFRVFQTTACGRPLLTDTKPELAECYRYGEELLAYDSDLDFAEKLEKALRTEDLKTISEAGRQRFLKDHTWEKRLEYVRNTVLR
jgi:glycosyltransferase involved in cell wall biosynthesis